MTDESIIKVQAQLGDVLRRIETIETSCGGCRTNLGDKFDRMNSGTMDAIQRLDERIRKLEVRMAFWMGTAAVIGAIGGQIFQRFFV